MTQQEAKEFWPLIKAWAEGRVLQTASKGESDWMDVKRGEEVSFDCSVDYRIKPTPKLRPWRTEEVPVGCLLRCSTWPKGNAIVLIELINDSIYLPNFGSLMRKELHELLTTYEYSLDHGKTWLPCGVMEET